MQTAALFHLWPRIHQDLLRFLELAPEASLAPDARERTGDDLGSRFRHLAAVEDYWRRMVLEREAPYREIEAQSCPDREALRARLAEVFAATEELLSASLADALLARPIAPSRYPARNALEALSLCHLHTVHHRAEIVSGLRAHGVDVPDWV